MTLKFRIIVGCLLVFAVIAVWGILKGYNHVDNFTSLDKYDSYLKQAYPEVEHISTDTLQALLKSDDNLLLVDCRKPEEYAISRITGAVNLSSAEAIEEHFKKLGSPPSSVVVYSAVGRRAVEIGREISKSNSQIPIKSYTKSFFSGRIWGC